MSNITDTKCWCVSNLISRIKSLITDRELVKYTSLHTCCLSLQIVLMLAVNLYIYIFIESYHDINIVTSTQGDVYPCFYLPQTNSCEVNYTFIDDDQSKNKSGYCVFNNDFCKDSNMQECINSYYDINITNGYIDHFVMYTLYYYLIFIIVMMLFFILNSGILICMDKKKILPSMKHDITVCTAAAGVILYTLLLCMICIWLPIATCISQPNKYCDIVCNDCYYINTTINIFIDHACCSMGSDSIRNFSSNYSIISFRLYLAMSTLVPSFVVILISAIIRTLNYHRQKN